MRLSVTARIALLASALALVSNLALIGFVWRQTHDAALDAIRRETIEKAKSMDDVYRTGGLAQVIATIGDARAPGDFSLLLAVLDARGRRIAGFAPRYIGLPLAPTAFRVADIDRTPAQLDAGYSLQRIGQDWLLVGRGLDQVEAEQRALERALAIAVAISIALGLAAGLVVARFVAGRLDNIARVIEAAGEGDLSRRVSATAGGGDAFDRLAAQLNAMLGRIEQLMAELRLVTDSLAHDLRSPLARLRAKAEQAVLAAEPAREAALAGLIAESDLLMRMLTMLLEISRSQAISRDRFSLVAPDDIVAEIAELYEPVAEDAGLRFDVSIDRAVPPMSLHRELLSQALANLMDNALKHGGAGGAVALSLTRAPDGIAFAVADRGPGIAAADRAQALKRFGRLDSARTIPGAGLGMALVEAVARLHEGRFELADNAPGLIARIVVPIEQRGRSSEPTA